ncbi:MULTISPECIES: hypothetical protein [unclassified Pseudomonas]|uniref:hypothetical protein n=1 Tax=unclassified Pseudomonas TaxID=196821 RepID=UPI0035BEE97A
MNTVSNKFLPLALAALVMGGCTTQPKTTPLTQDKTRIVGIWAMLPTGNGIANVTEYQPDGKVRLHPFNCAEPGEREVEVSDYTVAADGQSIHIAAPNRAFDLKVLAFTDRVMALGMPVADTELKFMYMKVDKVEPLCRLFSRSPEDVARQSPYRPSDFVGAPGIPAHAGMQRYIGNWANDEGQVQIRVARDASGNPYLFMPDSENWRSLYNNVRWQGDRLLFNSYAYSEKPSLYRHPYHKSNTPMSLEPQADGKVLLGYTIGSKHFEHSLKRVDD